MRRAIATLIAVTALFCASCASQSDPGSLTATALNSWSALLELTPGEQTSRLQILRDGRPIDAFDVSDRRTITYTDYLLWPSTTFVYDLSNYDRMGQLTSTQRVSIHTPAQAGAFPRFYAATSFWNQPIAAAATIDPGSKGMVDQALVPYKSAANFWAGSNSWAKPLTYANPSSSLYNVACTKYDCQTDVSFHIPAYAVPSTGSDHHLVVIDAQTGKELDMWLASYDQRSDSWLAGARYITDPTGWGAVCPQKQHCDGAVAAGFAALGGIVRPEEIAQGHIDHALFFTTPHTRRDFIACPATHTDGVHDDPTAIPEGARIQLDPAFPVDKQPWPRWEKIVAHALQTYGAYLGDTGDSLSVAAEATLDRGYDAWSMVGVPAFASIGNLPWSQFRVLTLKRC
ncbi:MAG: hypothetical protein QOH92_740 [Chloroflexota bacterium]|jgi:hypothetical protein|nr:hypothetical protein [Chloroflexota bacterium]